ncbi:amidohydrolase [Microdochium bolleyi]|uniref:Amidohydrolase n=1 Tax=Microdochium bolleyi TaxID=196109 RepID=A0A136IU61_9PEZI|nr:amidohydrolase [Microdochium bolleyi]
MTRKALFANARIARDHGSDSAHGHGSPATCMAVRGSTIVHIGNETDPEIAQFLRHGSVDRTDLGGHLVMPAFVDAHIHLLQLGISLTKVDVRDATTLEQVCDIVRTTAAAKPDDERLLFRGWRHGVTGHGGDIAAALDAIDSRPIYLDSDDLHAAWCSTSAIKEMGLTDAPDPEGGKIHRDKKTGRATGLLEEAAVLGIVWPFLGNILSRNQKLDCIRSAASEHNKLGYTAVIDMAMDEAYWELLKDLHAEGELSVRVAAHFLVMPDGDHDELRSRVTHVADLHKKFNLTSSPDLRVAGIKIICDGVVDGCTAAISTPYLTTGEFVQPVWTAEKLQVVLNAADAAGLQCALHAIGDEAVTMAVDGLETLPSRNRRHRIEHLELTRPQDARRLGELGITASVQPVHCDPSDVNNIWPSLVGHELCSRAFAYGEFHNHGAPMAIGTDAPTAPTPPWNNAFNATTRRSFRKPDFTGNGAEINPEFAMKLSDTLKAMSYGGAYSCFGEGVFGSLEKGKKADFIVIEGKTEDWEQDPVSLLSSRALSTWLGGVQVSGDHKRGESVR